MNISSISNSIGSLSLGANKAVQKIMLQINLFKVC